MAHFGIKTRYIMVKKSKKYAWYYKRVCLFIFKGMSYKTSKTRVYIMYLFVSVNFSRDFYYKSTGKKLDIVNSPQVLVHISRFDCGIQKINNFVTPKELTSKLEVGMVKLNLSVEGTDCSWNHL